MAYLGLHGEEVLMLSKKSIVSLIDGNTWVHGRHVIVVEVMVEGHCDCRKVLAGWSYVQNNNVGKTIVIEERKALKGRQGFKLSSEDATVLRSRRVTFYLHTWPPSGVENGHRLQ